MGRTATSPATRRGCGKCIGCRLEYARQWAVRCTHEAQLHENNCFITLTFDDKHLNNKNTLVKSDFQNFLKRLRKRFAPLVSATCEPSLKNHKLLKITKKYKPWDLRYFHCGEYGSKNERPHHHACLFNFDFPDKLPFSTGKGTTLYRSKILEDLWSDPETGVSLGFSSIGSVTYASAAYVAQYCLKKIDGNLAPGHYQGRLPEYTTSSRRPAPGLDWYKKYGQTDAYPRDYVVLNGVKGKIPKYYDKKQSLHSPEEYASLKTMRITKALTNPNNAPARQYDAEKITKAKKQLGNQRSL